MLVGHQVVLRPFRSSDLDGLYDLVADVREKGEFWPLGCISEPRWFKQFEETHWWSDDFKLFLITDRDGRYRGGGFRYFVNEARFRLMGGATVVQDP